MKIIKILAIALSLFVLPALHAQNPTQPTNLTETSVTETTIGLSWTASEDTDGGTVGEYHIYLDGSNVLGIIGGVTATLYDLEPGTEYSITIIALDNEMNESVPSDPLLVTTVADTEAPDVPLNLTQVSISATSVDISWDASSDNVLGGVSYDVHLDGAFNQTVTSPSATINSLDPVTEHDITVFAKDESGNISATSEALSVTTLPDEDPPSVPTNLAEGTVTETSITVIWTASTDNVGIAEYTVSIDPGAPQTVTGTSATFEDLEPATSYNITVSANDAAGNSSAETAVLAVTTLADTDAPTIPEGFAEGTITETSATITWDASTDNIGVVSYDVYRDDLLNQNVTGPEVTFIGLTASTAYEIKVSAKDAAGNASAQSAAFSFTTATPADDEAPTVPAGLAEVAVTLTTAEVSWDASTDNVGVDHYVVYVDDIENQTVTETSATISSLTPGTAYDITVEAVDAIGNTSTKSTALTVTTTADTEAPVEPTNFAQDDITETSVDVSWTAATDNVGVVSYTLWVGPDEDQTVTGTSATIESLEPNTEYSLWLRANDASENRSEPVQLIVTTLEDAIAPSIPANLTAGTITATTAAVSWDASTDNVGVVDYIVYVDGSESTTVAAPAVNLTSLTPETSYSITVAARDAAGNTSAASAAVEITTTELIDENPPGVPTGIVADVITATSIELSWTPSVDPEDNLTGYNVFVDDGTPVAVTDAAYVLSDLAPGTTYSIEISAVDGASNESARSAALEFTTLEDLNAPTVPTDVATSAITTTSATISWTASTDAEGEVVEYRVYVDSDPYLIAAGTSLALSGLTPETTYGVQVSAVDDAGNESAKSPVINVTTAADEVAPSVPSNLTEVNVTVTTIQISWDASTDAGGGTVSGYNIYLGGALRTNTSGTSFTLSPLAPGTAYEITVTAVDDSGNESAPSSPLNSTTSYDNTAPSTPTNLAASGSTQTSISLVWTGSTDNVAVVGYNVYMDGDLIGTPTNASFNATGLEASGLYSFYVRAIDAEGNESDPSNSIAAMTQSEPDSEAPTVATGLRSTAVTNTSINLAWLAATDNVGVTEYQIYMDDELLGSSTTLNYSATELTSGTSYSFYVIARDAEGNASPQSSSISVTTTVPVDVTSPTSPSELTADPVLETSATLTWTAATDDFGVTSYQIYQDDALVGSTAELTFTATGLLPATTYSYYVVASDAAGNDSDPSNTLNITTTSDRDLIAPDVPSGLHAMDSTASTITLGWSASTDNVGVVDYIVYFEESPIDTITVLSFTLEGLIPASIYKFQISARDAAGNVSASSEAVFISTVDPGPDLIAPTAPTALVVVDSTFSSISLKWEPSYDLWGISNYRVYIDDDMLRVITTETSATIEELEAATSYSFYVTAIDPSNNVSAHSNLLVASTRIVTAIRNSYVDNSPVIIPLEGNAGFRIQMHDDLVGPLNLQVIDLSGRLVLDRDFPPIGSESIVVEESFQPGLYIVRMQYDDKFMSKQIILR